jgi:hypothetical protein
MKCFNGFTVLFLFFYKKFKLWRSETTVSSRSSFASKATAALEKEHQKALENFAGLSKHIK